MLIKDNCLKLTDKTLSVKNVNEINTWGCNDFDKYDFIDAIDNAPTVKARPQGEWNILQKDDNGIHEIECPFCKYSKGGRFTNIGVTFHKLPPFCEACGAQMKGGAEND